jgi:hypothetical protein
MVLRTAARPGLFPHRFFVVVPASSGMTAGFFWAVFDGSSLRF